MTWKPVPGFGSVEVSDDGQVRRNGRVLRQRDHIRGYKVVFWGQERHFVHRLVLLAFVGPPPTEKHEAMHLDNAPGNNRSENLQWGTHAENMAHDKGHKHSFPGELNRNAKVSPADVARIRAAYESKSRTHWGRKALAIELGISEKQVWLIATRRIGGWNQ